MKILGKLFDARSPLWQLMLALLLVSWFSYGAEAGINSSTFNERGGFEFSTSGPFALIISVTALVVFLGAYLVVMRHNKRHPKNKLSIWQPYPPELLHGDEMLENASQGAAKRVYIYNNYALPIMMWTTLFYLQYPLAIGSIFALYLSGYYLTYLYSLWPYLGED